MRLRLALASLLAAPLHAEPAPRAEPAPHAEPPLRAGVLADAAPFVVHDAHGQLSGFAVELFRLIAARMGRPITFELADQPTLYARLARGELDVLPGPIAATPDRAADMLLTEGYSWSEYRFGARSGEPVTRLEDLRGRRLAVRAGSPYEEWARRQAAHYGFTPISVQTSLAGADSVLHHQADASLSGSLIQDYAARQNANFVPGLSLPETRTHESAAVRRGEAELRDEMEDALQCLKMSGTVARLSATWFGREPDAEDLENLVVPGYGVPGLAGYDPKPRHTRC